MNRTIALLLGWSLVGCTPSPRLWVDTPLEGATLSDPDVVVRALLGGRDREEVCVRAYLDGQERTPDTGRKTPEGYEFELPDSVSWSLTDLEEGDHGLRIEWSYCDRSRRRRTLVRFTVDTSGTGSQDSANPGDTGTPGGTGAPGDTGEQGTTGSTAQGSGGSGA